jgi:hypothetical protein
MSYAVGKDATFTWGGTDINGIERYGRRSGRTTTKRSIFMASTQISTTGPLNETVTLSGITDPADAGIAAILASKAAQTPDDFEYLYDGANGFTQPMQVASFDSDETPDDFLAFTITLEPTGAATAVGTGPVI